VILIEYIVLAGSLMAFTFGYNEKMCGDIGHPVACSAGARTASGEPFKPQTIASAALPLPRNIRIKAQFLLFKAKNGTCVPIRINDRAPEKWIGKRGFEFTPAALRKLGFKASPHWSGRVEICEDPV
jgi:rare lipoprotein A (peptidoglycan hydrolase)